MELIAWAKAFEDGDKRVAMTTLPDGKRVSTVWMGLDHRFGHGAPLIFETMVFPPEGAGDLDCDRYSTEEEAIAGHARMVTKWSAIPPATDAVDPSVPDPGTPSTRDKD